MPIVRKNACLIRQVEAWTEESMWKIARPLSVSVPLLLVLLLGGCAQMSQSLYLAGYDRDISSSTRDIEAARDDAHRAVAYTKRGDAYSEKARYSRACKLISPDEYARLFGLAIKDHDQAIALDPASSPCLKTLPYRNVSA